MGLRDPTAACRPILVVREPGNAGPVGAHRPRRFDPKAPRDTRDSCTRCRVGASRTHLELVPEELCAQTDRRAQRAVVCPGGFEPPTYGLEGRCSVRAELRADGWRKRRYIGSAITSRLAASSRCRNCAGFPRLSRRRRVLDPASDRQVSRANNKEPRCRGSGGRLCRPLVGCRSEMQAVCQARCGPMRQEPPLFDQGIYSQRTLTWSTTAAISPFALMVRCNFSCTRKLFPLPGPMMRRSFSNKVMACPSCNEDLNWP